VDPLAGATFLVKAAVVRTIGPDWLDPEYILTSFGDIGFWIVVGIIFAECGLLIGFFLPGDSLLFVTGLFIASGTISMNIWFACAILFAAALLGNVTGYWIGRKAGPSLFSRPDSRLFKQEYVEHTHQFFTRYGARAIVLARFVPIVRTFITATAGIGRMDFRRYLVFSAVGGFVWAVGITMAGYFLGTIEFVKENVDLIIILVILVSVVPIAFAYLKRRRHRASLQ
jgi:membrane-associated protein